MRRRATTVIEVLVVILLMSIVLTVVYGLIQSATRQRQLVTTYADLADQTRRAVRRLSKDIRSASLVRDLERSRGTTMRRMVLAVPRGLDPLEGYVDVIYEYEPERGTLTRDGAPLLREQVRAFEVHAFDDLGTLLEDAVVPHALSHLRIRLEFGAPDAPPNQRRHLELTLAPRVPSSQAKAERELFERAFERFTEPGLEPAPPGFGGRVR